MALAGCTDIGPLVSVSEGNAVARQCVNETAAPGTYSISPGQASSRLESRIPTARAVETLGGTKAGADAINACIQRRVLGDQSVVATGESVTATPAVAPTPVPQEATFASRVSLAKARGCIEGLGPIQGGTRICPGF